MFTMTRPFDDIEFAALDRMIGETYRQFKDRVATGRGLSMDQVEEVARGHVWSGSDAKERGLVDEMGGFFDAVDLARAQAGLSSSASYALITYNPWMGSRNFIPAYLIHMLGPQVDLPPAIQHLAELSALKDEHVYAMMPYYLEIQ
jgi:ClpP class serine protease